MGKVKHTAEVNEVKKSELLELLERALHKSYEVWDIQDYEKMTNVDTEIIKLRLAICKLQKRAIKMCEKV